MRCHAVLCCIIPCLQQDASLFVAGPGAHLETRVLALLKKMQTVSQAPPVRPSRSKQSRLPAHLAPRQPGKANYLCCCAMLCHAGAVLCCAIKLLKSKQSCLLAHLRQPGKRFAMPCFALLCFALLCFALLCFVLIGLALLCFALLCFALLCADLC